jgi:methylated-DNA-protein-cysteine methyltransferase-like protein
MKTKSAELTKITFRADVYSIVRQIPAGKVLNYGVVAELIGRPRSARQVGYALRSLGLNESNIPWWRVVNKNGYLSIDHGDGGYEKIVQRQLLEDEGIVVNEDNTLNMSLYFWKSNQ